MSRDLLIESTWTVKRAITVSLPDDIDVADEEALRSFASDVIQETPVFECDLMYDELEDFDYEVVE